MGVWPLSDFRKAAISLKPRDLTVTDRSSAQLDPADPDGDRSTAGQQPGDRSLDAEQIRGQVRRIIQSPGFSSAPRLKRLLEHVAEATIAGRERDLTESVLAVEVFDRDASFDPGSDSIVRANARRLREKLGAYYASDGREDAIRAEMPKGHYRLVFSAATELRTAAGIAEPSVFRGRHLGWLAFLAITIVAVSAIWSLDRSSGRWTVATERSIGVMPISAIGRSEAAIELAASLKPELEAVLATYPELRLIPATAASYRIEGSVQESGQRIRLTAKLTRTHDDETVWATPLERREETAALTSKELASTVARFVRLQLVQDQRCEAVRRTSNSMEAVDTYCRALSEENRAVQVGDADSAIILRSAERAIQLDPKIVDAYRLAANTYFYFGYTGAMDWQFATRKANSLLAQGLALVPDDPGLLTVKAMVQGRLELNHPAAEQSLLAALASNPQDPNVYQTEMQLGILAVYRGDIQQALEHYRRSLKFNDGYAWGYVSYASGLWAARQNEELVQVSNAGLKLTQSGPLRAYLLMMKAYGLLGLEQPGAASAALDEALATVGPKAKVMLAGPLASVGRFAEARMILAELEAMKSPPVEYLVRAYVALHESDKAFERIHEAIDRRINNVIALLRSSPSFDDLRMDSRWAGVIAHLETAEADGRAQGGP